MQQDATEMELLKQQQDNDPNSLYADSMREEKVANILEQIDPSNLLDEIYHKLLGERYNKGTSQWEPISKDTKPLHPLLISRFVSFLGSVLNQNTTLSNYSLNEVNARMNNIIEWIARDLPVNADTYKLTGQYTEWERVGNIICETCSSVFRRAIGGMESKRIFASLRMTESLSQNKSPSKFMDNFKFWS